MSSVSKGEKTIPTYFRTINKELMEKLNIDKNRGRIGENDLTIKVRELIAFGKESGVFGES